MSTRDRFMEPFLRTVPFASIVIFLLWFTTGVGLFDIVSYFFSIQPLESFVRLLRW